MLDGNWTNLTSNDVDIPAFLRNIEKHEIRWNYDLPLLWWNCSHDSQFKRAE